MAAWKICTEFIFSLLPTNNKQHLHLIQISKSNKHCCRKLWCETDPEGLCASKWPWPACFLHMHAAYACGYNSQRAMPKSLKGLGGMCAYRLRSGRRTASLWSEVSPSKKARELYPSFNPTFPALLGRKKKNWRSKPVHRRACKFLSPSLGSKTAGREWSK